MHFQDNTAIYVMHEPAPLPTMSLDVPAKDS